MEFRYFPAELGSLPIILAYIRTGLTEDLFLRLELAAEEALVNIIQHAYEGKKGTIGISFLNLETAVQDDKVMEDSDSKDCVNLPSSTAVSRLNGTQLVIQDNGIPFNPLIKRQPSCVERDEGCGLRLLAHSAPKASYQRIEGKNYLFVM